MPKIFVKREFRFIEEGPKEHKFLPGYRDITDEMAKHPFFAKYHADGAVESAAETEARANKAAKDAEAANALNARLRAESFEAFARAQGKSPDELRAEQEKKAAEVAAAKAAAEKAATDKAAAEKAAAEKAEKEAAAKAASDKAPAGKGK